MLSEKRECHLKLPLILLVVICGAVLVSPHIPVTGQSFAYALSLTIKEVLLFLLPIIIFALIFSSIVRLKNGALRLIILLLPLICISNLITTWTSYFFGNFIIAHSELTLVKDIAQNTLQPLWTCSLPRLIQNKYAMFIALGMGLGTGFYSESLGHKVADTLSFLSNMFLNRIFLPIMPIFIVGFVIKFQYDGILSILIKNYAFIFFAVFISQLIYVLLLYFIAAKGKFLVMLNFLRNMLPAGISGFSAMSSAVAMPLTLVGTEKNLENKELTNFVIPSTVNFHLIGDCIAIPIFAMAIMISFGYQLPGLLDYAVFVSFFVIAKFGVAAIPGGGILVMWPILSAQLGFTSEMLSVIHAIYIMFDSVITSMNVMGNGAFAILFAKIYKKTANCKLALHHR